MNSTSPRFSRFRTIGIALASLAAGPFLSSTALAPPTPPAWWSARGAVNGHPPDDTAAAAIGQLKHIAAKAIEEFEAKLPPPGAGPELHALAASWQLPPALAPTRDDSAALTVGQLKAIGKLFYDRMNDAGFSEPYPWTATTADDDDNAIANLGQLKRVFAFSVTDDVDTDGDGIPDGWETRHGMDPHDPSDATEDPDRDLQSNLVEYQTGTNPHDGIDPQFADTDGDGFSNQHELEAGTNPLSADSFPLVCETHQSNRRWRVSLNAASLDYRFLQLGFFIPANDLEHTDRSSSARLDHRVPSAAAAIRGRRGELSLRNRSRANPKL